MGSRKGLGMVGQVALAFLLIGLVSAGLYGAYSLTNQGSGVGDDGDTGDQDQTPDDSSTVAPWTGFNVKVNLEGTNLSGDTVTSGDLHIFQDKPDAWGDDQGIQQVLSNSWKTEAVEADGVTTLQYEPGTYYVVYEGSNDYPTFKEITIPDGDGRFGDQFDNVGEYNNNPRDIDFKVSDRYSLGVKNWDLGIDSNTSETETYSDYVTYDVSENTEYRMDYMVVSTGDVATSTYAPNQDEDVDGTYDEGLTSSVIKVSGASNMNGEVEKEFFNPSLGIDMLGSDGKAKVELSAGEQDYLKFDSANKPTVTAEVTAVESGDGSASASGDEKASDGENFWDVVYFDSAGNSNSAGSIVG